MTSIVVIGLIIYLLVKNTGKDKKMTTKGLLIIPILMIYEVYTSLQGVKGITIADEGVFFIAIAIGGVVGLIRSKFYSYRIEGDQLFYKKHMTDTIILLGFIALEGVLRYVFKAYESNFFVLVNVSLMMFATTSVVVRRIMMFIDSRKLKYVKPLI
ncbi:MAG: hypothetical protein ACRC41_12800 [Sarcina sp.]